MSIPRKIHQAWVGPKPMSDRDRAWCEQMKAMNPAWEHRTHGNELLERYGQDPYVKALLGKQSPWAYVMDRLRVLLLRDFGGLWLDADCQPIKPLDSSPVWDFPHIQFVAGLRSPYRKQVALSRGVPLCDNTVLGSVPNGIMVRRLDALWVPSAIVVTGHTIGMALMAYKDYTTELFGFKEFYAEEIFPETIVLHDCHNDGTWMKERHAA